MNVDAFRHLYEYHFFENHKLWDDYVTPLSQEQFTRDIAYSHGSVRNQVVHLINTEDTWFCELRGIDLPRGLNPTEVDDRKVIRAHWDKVEEDMREYLAQLQDDMLFAKPIKEPEEDKALVVWQVLLHVINHGTDHRAQLLRVLHDLGVKTGPQDYIFYVFDHLE